MGKFDLVMKNSAMAIFEPYIAENDWGILVASIMMCDVLCLEPQLKRWNLGHTEGVEPSIFDELTYFYNLERTKDFKESNTNSNKSLEESLQSITSLLCPYASIGGHYLYGQYDSMNFQLEMISNCQHTADQILKRMQSLNLSIEEQGSVRSKVFSTAINHIRSLHNQGENERLEEIAKNIHTKMVQLSAFMKLMQKYEEHDKFDWVLGYIATSVAMLNYLTFGNNEGEPLFANCLDNEKSLLKSIPTTIMLYDMPKISKYVYNARKISPMMVDLICCRDSKDISLVNKLVDVYAYDFVEGKSFCSADVDTNFNRNFSGDNMQL